MALRELMIVGVLMSALAPVGTACAADRTAVSTALDVMLADARRFEADGRDDRAALLYQRAHEAYPLAAAPLLGWGALANRIGAYDEAVTILEAALTARAGDREVRRNLGVALIGLDRGHDALRVFERLLAEDSSQAADWNGKGMALDLIDRHPEAQIAYRSGLGIAPDHAELSRNLQLSLAADTDPPSDPLPATGVTVAYNAGTPASSTSSPLDRVSRSVGRDP